MINTPAATNSHLLIKREKKKNTSPAITEVKPNFIIDVITKLIYSHMERITECMMAESCKDIYIRLCERAK